MAVPKDKDGEPRVSTAPPWPVSVGSRLAEIGPSGLIRAVVSDHETGQRDGNASRIAP